MSLWKRQSIIKWHSPEVYVLWVEEAMKLKMYRAGCAVRLWLGKVRLGKEQAIHPVQEDGSKTSGNETNYQQCYCQPLVHVWQ